MRAKSKIVQDGIQPTIYNPFIGEICKIAMAQIDHPDANYSNTSEEHTETLSLQQGILRETILHGILHKDWTIKLYKQWKPLPPLNMERNLTQGMPPWSK